jgi:putative flippase GtrA
MKTSQQFFLFSGIGAIGTAAHYSLLIFLVQAVHFNPVPATTAGFALGALINYILNYRITFNSSKRHREALIKFLSVALVGALINGVLMNAGMELFDLHYVIIQMLATGVVVTFNFIANKYWTFASN